VYLHLEPGNSMVGVGLYHPPPDALRTIREAVVADPDGWTASTTMVGPRSWEFKGETLTRAPRGFPADHPLVDDLKRTSFAIGRPLTEKQVTGPNVLRTVVDRAVEARPLLAWLCRALALPL
jgi:uncharacterized protein (TIGR02453 family)